MCSDSNDVCDYEPSEAYRLYEAGRSAQQQGNYPEALELLQRSCSLEPHFKTLLEIGVCYMELGRREEAIEPLAAATALNKGVKAPGLLARTLAELERIPEALGMCLETLERDPRNRIARSVVRSPRLRAYLRELDEQGRDCGEQRASALRKLEELGIELI